MASPDDNLPSRLARERPPPPSKAEVDEFYQNARLSLPTPLRLPLASVLSFLAGFTLGTAQGGKAAGLRFRAEHAHKLPTSVRGWYLYHKSKNYHMAYGGILEGIKMGGKVSFWTTAMSAIEEMFDSYRGTADLFNTVTSCVTVAGGFSLWNRFSLPMTARTTKAALVAGIVYGGLQDLVGIARGRPIGYVDWIKGRLGSPRQEQRRSQ
ncbi:uncharacterized protein THITE_2120542 [Thermothielavioides terrestris NRRL 8126]|uniref:Uncharacterized protein n=1 Tax=Thermothielavioides terrestris (strain ATCC 38088 / NRRL 8126) TaxID=578455 RepID=G2RCL1_THETT|nr:uncharacterized protein THITE_2120542 [Thermothielavioides terrestris NRRL 8126]AEO69802.1 hypothetical protein THITE_2120542 [Thermothielavioides terrestris NRRL 8126]